MFQKARNEKAEGWQREASLSNPDPLEDSSTAAFLKQNASYMVPTYVRPPPVMTKGEGCYIWDMENRRYLDFTAGIAVNALGHADPEMCNLIMHQSRTLIHASNLYHNPWTPALSQLMVDETQRQVPGSPLTQAFISNSGSEANEAALKFARKVAYAKDPSSHKRKILSFHNSFHGRTYGSLSATPNQKYQAPFGPMLPGFSYGSFNDTSSLSSLITPSTCAVIVEPIQGEGGVNVATPEFLQALRHHCTLNSALLIFDEIQCGLSRTGSLWAHSAYPDTHPDILTTAKALGNGIPIGATLVSGSSVAPHIKTGDHGTTFGGNPFVCRIAHYVFSRLATDATILSSIPGKSALITSFFTNTLQRKFPGLFSEIRGRGLILGMQLAEGHEEKAAKIVTAARERGLLVITAGNGVLRIVPPLVISEEEIGEGLRVLEEAVGVVWREGMGQNVEVEGTKGQQEMAGR
ncbi:MAG: hypothetical protein Q9160_003318 [Pyrenula sp. 1 TL-2023]